MDGNKIVIKSSQGGQGESEITVTTDGQTRFIVDYDTGKLADLKPTMRVYVMSVGLDDQQPAQLFVRAESAKCIQGRIIGVEGTKLIVNANVPGGVKQVTVATDDKTRVLFGQCWRGFPSPAQLGKLDDLAPGMLVKVVPDTGTAAKIFTPPALGGAMAR